MLLATTWDSGCKMLDAGYGGFATFVPIGTGFKYNLVFRGPIPQ